MWARNWPSHCPGQSPTWRHGPLASVCHWGGTAQHEACMEARTLAHMSLGQHTPNLGLVQQETSPEADGLGGPGTVRKDTDQMLLTHSPVRGQLGHRCAPDKGQSEDRLRVALMWGRDVRGGGWSEGSVQAPGSDAENLGSPGGSGGSNAHPVAESPLSRSASPYL